MRHKLQRFAYNPAVDRGAVADFDCGDAPWEKELSQWLKVDCEPFIAEGKVRVWLYASDRDGFVGFASLSEVQWRYPTQQDQPLKHLHVPALAISRTFQGQPSDVPNDERYAVQILRDLMFEVTFSKIYPRVLSLYVHPENRRAIAFYEKMKFVPLKHRIYKDPQNGVKYRAMVLTF